ncbi:hypothetical protein BGZ65_009136 [Modicella reniformis]|uniref:Dihydroorotase n=1 Tax=Modicella reniformis TaxID=1440133 RepID=A0A9P6MAV1_9FUNG|nr:hypothetical protein BGZ65_009136 [Modicella reniformis]
MVDTITIPTASDMHVHLRQGSLMSMPNLQPPISTTEMALAYEAELEQLAPKVTFLMSLYLNPSLTPQEIKKAANAGIRGVKSYPRGVTTNSESGIESYDIYYPVFKAMEEEGMVLNLHGEIPSDPEKNVCVMNAEEKFLNHLKDIHLAFPNLKIILEHATTEAAVTMVKSLGETVGCTITVHHLQLVVDDWAGKCHNFCKPVAKYPSDRAALRNVIKEGHPRFFLGSDSAPHPSHMKEGPEACAGVFTTPLVLPYLATILESFGALDRLEDFACSFGRKFYEIKEEKWVGQVTLVRESWNAPKSYGFGGAGIDGEQGEVVPFMAGKPLGWKIASIA